MAHSLRVNRARGIRRVCVNDTDRECDCWAWRTHRTRPRIYSHRQFPFWHGIDEWIRHCRQHMHGTVVEHANMTVSRRNRFVRYRNRVGQQIARLPHYKRTKWKSMRLTMMACHDTGREWRNLLHVCRQPNSDTTIEEKTTSSHFAGHHGHPLRRRRSSHLNNWNYAWNKKHLRWTIFCDARILGFCLIRLLLLRLLLRQTVCPKA